MDYDDDSDVASWRAAVDTFREALRVQAPETLPAPLLAYLNGSPFGERCVAVLGSDAAAVRLPASELSGEWQRKIAESASLCAWSSPAQPFQ